MRARPREAPAEAGQVALGPHAHAHAHHGPGGHHHHAHPSDFGRAFAAGIALNLAFVGVEAAYGFWANSMALLADAGHNLSDVLGLAVAWVGAVLLEAAALAPVQLRPARRLDPRRARQCDASC